MPHAARKAPPQALPRPFSQIERQKVEARIEALLASAESLIAALDLADGDTDREPNLAGTPWRDQDREGGDIQDDPHDEDPAEPSLAHGNDFDQGQALANLDLDNLRGDTWFAEADLEEEHDGREPHDARWFVPAVG